MKYRELLYKRQLLRDKLNVKTSCRLYAYIYRANLSKAKILNRFSEMGRANSYINKLKRLTMMQLCCRYKYDIITAIVDIKLPFSKVMVLC